MMGAIRFACLPLAVAGALALPVAVQAQAQPDEDSIRARFRLPAPPAIDVPDFLAIPAMDAMVGSSPAMSANSPSAFGATFGQVFAGASYQARVRYSDGDDGAVAVGAGLGDPMRWVGLDVTAHAFTTVRRGWGDRMGVDVKLHRVLGAGMAVAVGWESAWVRGGTDSGQNRYAVVSRYWRTRAHDHQAFSALVVSVGVGDGRFQREAAFYAGEKGVNLFGSVGVRVAPPLSVVLDWTGQDLVTGVSVAPFRSWPVVLTAGLADVTGRAGDGARFATSAGFGFDVCTLFSC